MEQYFVENYQITNEILGTNVKEFYSQLPVGTFYKVKSNKTRVFTGGKSAIDFWGIENNTLNIVELKAKKNASLGILSELFFYVCLIRDFHVKQLIKPCGESEIRGFNKLKNINRINGIILTEAIHPQLRDAFNELKLAFNVDRTINFDKIIKYDSTKLTKK